VLFANVGKLSWNHAALTAWLLRLVMPASHTLPAPHREALPSLNNHMWYSSDNGTFNSSLSHYKISLVLGSVCSIGITTLFTELFRYQRMTA
jgi:hypothetical protein